MINLKQRKTVDTRILPTTARLAKEAGFYWDQLVISRDDRSLIKPIIELVLGVTTTSNINYCYNDKDQIITPKMFNLNNNHYPAPTQSELQTWLRDEHKIDCFVTPYTHDEDDSKFKNTKYTADFIWELLPEENVTDDEILFDSYEVALEYILVEALKQLINK